MYNASDIFALMPLDDPDAVREMVEDLGESDAIHPTIFRQVEAMFTDYEHRAYEAYRDRRPFKRVGARPGTMMSRGEHMKVVISHHKRASSMGAESTLTCDQWVSIFESHGGACAYCVRAAARSVDHIVPLSRGGANSASNVVPACMRCNSSKHAQPVWEWMARTSRDADAFRKRMAVAAMKREA